MSYPAKIITTSKGETQLRVKVGSRWRPGREVECANPKCAYPIYIPEWMTESSYGGRNNPKVHYCSQSCYQKTRQKAFVTNICIICEASFPVSPPSHADRYKACSPECRSEYNRRRTTARHQAKVSQ